MWRRLDLLGRLFSVFGGMEGVSSRAVRCLIWRWDDGGRVQAGKTVLL